MMKLPRTVRQVAHDLGIEQAEFLDIVHSFKGGAIYSLDHVMRLEDVSRASEIIKQAKLQIKIPRRQLGEMTIEHEANTMVGQSDDLVEKQAKLTWDSNPAIREEFKKFSTYRAYCLAAAKGSFKILGETRR